MGIRNAIKLPEQYDALLTELTRKDDAPFDAMYEVVIFAAALGYHHQNKVAPVAPFRQDAIASHLFGREEYGILYDNIVLLSALDDGLDDPVAEAFSQDANSDYGLKIFIEYVCGGLELISQRRADRHTFTPIDDFAEWIEDLLEELPD